MTLATVTAVVTACGSLDIESPETYVDSARQSMCEFGGCANGYACVKGHCVPECVSDQDCESECCLPVRSLDKNFCAFSSDDECAWYKS